MIAPYLAPAALAVLMAMLTAACSGESVAPPSPTPSVSESPTTEPSPTPTARYVEVIASSCLNIRQRPSTDAPVLGCAPSGTVLRRGPGVRNAEGRRWWQVRGAFTGWAAAEFLAPTDPPDESG